MNSSYEIIVADIITKLSTGQLTLGQKMPSEPELIEIYKMSKMTIRKAMSKLKDLDIIESKGRNGTYIKSPGDFHNSSSSYTLGYSLNAKLKGKLASTTVLEFKSVTATQNLAQKLNLTVDDELYFIKRLRYLDGLPSAVEIVYIPKIELPTLRIEHLSSSLYDILYKEKNVTVKNVYAKLTSIIPTKDLIQLLELQPGEGLILLEQVTRTNLDSNFEFVLSFQAGSRINI